MRILLVPNSFKNSLSSVEISEILSSELSKIKDVEILLAPLSDGGDGFIGVIEFYKKESLMKIIYEIEFGGKLIKCPVLIDESDRTIYLESASVIGLRLLKDRDLNPLNFNSYPFGKILVDLIVDERKNKIPSIEKIIIGIGGTATIDFGLGAVNALGVKFIEKKGSELNPLPKYFERISRIELSDIPNKSLIETLKQKSIYCIVDVETKLLGQNNAVEIYGRQKGADEKQIKFIIEGIKNIISVLNAAGFSIDELRLKGAGGGLAAGLNLFLGAEIISAQEFITRDLLGSLKYQIPDFIISAEGKFDHQSFKGKASGVIIEKYSSKVKNIFIICGTAEQNNIENLPRTVEIIQIKEYFESVEESIKNAQLGIKLAAKKIVKQISDRSLN